jgi:tetratricopeptide (TPR) repeat protein
VQRPVLKSFCAAARSASRGPLAAALGLALAAASLLGCNGAATAEGGGRPQTADKWYRRAQQHFQSADVEEAHDSVGKALAIVPTDKDVRMLAAHIALSRLEYAEAMRFLKGMTTSEAAGLRGRALWYKGDLEGAADELEAMLNDPDVKDEWAKGIAKLARRGAGRTPFSLSGGLLAAVEMPHVSQVVPFFVVPLEIDGDAALALVATGMAELVLDSATRQEPSWVSLRFGKRLEVHDVPALTQDLSGISRDLGAPIKALLGINLLRHLNVTMDYAGHQFVARSFAPPAPPNATRTDVYYYRGGGMVVRSGLSPEKSTSASLLVDTSMRFPIALDQGGWKKAGIETKDLKLIPEDPEQRLRQGVVPIIRLGAYDVPKVPGVFEPGLSDMEKVLSPLNLDGVVGAGLLAFFRITIGDGGRTMWLEDNAPVQKMLEEMNNPLDEPELPAGPETAPPGPKDAPPTKPAPTAPPATKAPGPSKTTPDR